MRAESVLTDEGFKLHCTRSGDGGRVLIGLHGGPGGSGGGYLEPLHRLSGPDRTVATFDQLGTGASDVPPPEYEWSLARAVADVDAVRRHCAAERVDLLGHSWGGMLALQYALDHPEHVGRLVLSNTAASTARVTLGSLAQLADVLPETHASAAVTADALGDHDAPAFRTAVEVWLACYGTDVDVDAAREEMQEALDPGPAGHGLWGDRLWFATGALRDWDVEPRLPEITAPTLIVHGGDDMSSAETNRVLAERIPGSEWLTMNNNGHTMFHARNEPAYLAIVRAFLDGWDEQS
ncbi:proline iminopeptidase-family hydrolase [Streptomyces sp. NBC_00878]|uniref:proline iminopeptidase-family hydrolase n=1 Tax=Streptomyces sp. NBC_00878 TaxID=2975854 RepID=UPI00225A47E6|nr:proline iminopeptidase-family hydrolase [Streptomyces sp. NBC_00878]MCX4911680.1 proline iminopeptidase-family hydrolase [Streptomyces sp. NBC_00878]